MSEGKQLGQRLGSLSPAQRKLLELRAKKKRLDLDNLAERAAERAREAGASAESGAPAPIPRQRPAGPLPMAYDPERIYFLHELNPENPFYNILCPDLFRGTIDVPRLRRAAAALIARHENFRTRFVVQEGRPIQAIEAPMAMPVPEVDLSRLPRDMAVVAADREVFRYINRPYALDRLPLFRLIVAHVAGDEVLLGLGFHHIVIDWVSALSVQEELARLYATGGDPVAAGLPDLPVQMADFALWQRQRFEAGEIDGQLDYWRKTLRDAPQTTVLPLDNPRPPVLAGHGRRRHFQLPEAACDALRALAQREGTTLFMATLALFKATVLRLTGQTRLIVGSPVSARTHPDLEHLLGYLLHHLPFLTDLGGDPSFRETLRRVRKTMLDAFANQEVPFAKLLEAVAPERDLRRMPLNQLTVLFLAPHEVTQGKFPGLDKLPYLFNGECSKFDITFVLWDKPRFDGVVEHNASIFDLSTIDHLIDAFRQLLVGIAEDADRPLNELALMSPLAERQVVEEAPPALPALEEASEEMLEAVAKIWRDVLPEAPEELGAEHDFFALGGMSLGLLQVRHLVAERLGQRVELVELARRPRLGEVAAWIAALEIV